MAETIEVSWEAPLAVITLNRPRGNPISWQMMTELGDALDEIAASPDIRAVVVAGRKRLFCVGADISEIGAMTAGHQAQAFSAQANRLFSRFQSLPQPMIAAIDGLALGGGLELALACDLRIAAENASFGLPEVKLGLMPGAGGTQRLPRLVGLGRAMEMIMTGRAIDAAEALRIGLVNQLAPAAELLGQAKSLAGRLADLPPLALKAVKHTVYRGFDLDMPAALDLESAGFGLLFATEDRAEGLSAFQEKRPPRFHGR
jgi:enoyl-CoA hydratase